MGSSCVWYRRYWGAAGEGIVEFNSSNQWRITIQFTSVVFAINNSIALIKIKELETSKLNHCSYIYQLFSVAMRLFELFDQRRKMS